MLVNLRSYRNLTFLDVTRWSVVVAGLLAALSVLGQTDSPVGGTVMAKDGQPIAGVTVSSGKACCPPRREQATTDQSGLFRIEHAGPVIHFFKDKLEPKAFVVGSERLAIHITLEPSTDDLVAPVCGKLKAGQQRIGWGKYGLQFNVIKRDVQILGGKTDVDYVLYVIKPRTGEGHLELWFGPYAISQLPDDDQFVKSDKFALRYVVASDGGLIGVDSWGKQSGGGIWRHTAVMGQGGSIYRDSSPEQASLFDQIVNSICEIPYPGHQ